MKKSVLRVLTAVIITAMMTAPVIPASANATADRDAGVVGVAENLQPSGPQTEKAQYDPEELLVLVEKGTSKSEIRQIAEENDAELDNVNSLNDGTKMALLRAEDGSIQDQIISIQSEDSVIIAQPNYKYKLQDNEVNDPEACSEQWYLKSPTQTAGGVDAYGAWDALQVSDSAISSKPIVAVIDTGVKQQHEDLADCLLIDKCRTFNNGGNYRFDALDGTDDDNGHGTHVCGIIGASKNNGKGIAGIAGNRVSIMCLDACNEDGYFKSRDLVNSIEYSILNGAKVINMSLGGLYKDFLMEKEIQKAWDKGVMCVSAAGNEDASSIASPSDSPCGISVMNHNKEGNLTDSSNYGIEKDVSAPGDDIYSTYKSSNSSYTSKGGTSMASPVVAGFAALLLSENSNLTPRQLKNLIYTSSGKDGFEPGKNSQNNGAGFGRINLKNGIDNLHALSSEVQPTNVILNKTDISMYVGESTSIEYEVLPGSTTGVDATFKSYNTSVAEVDEYGAVTAKSPGTAYILVTCGNKGMYCKVTVEEVPYNQIDHIPYNDEDAFSESDPLAFVGNSAYYMHAYKIQLERNETMQVCMQGEAEDNYDLYLRMLDSSGEVVRSIDNDNTGDNGENYETFSYTAGDAGEYTLQTVFGGTDDTPVHLSSYDYALKIASNKVTTNPRVESDHVNCHISWNAAGDADGYIVKKYSDAGCSSIISERDISGTAWDDSAGTSDCYYTVTPYIESAAGRLFCKESAPVKVTGETAELEHRWRMKSFTWTKVEDGYTAKANFECENDSSHKESVEATVSKRTSKGATCEEAGKHRFTAFVTAANSPDGTRHEGYKDVDDIPALGHDWNDGTTIEDLSQKITTFTCRRCGKTRTETTTKEKTPGTKPSSAGETSGGKNTADNTSGAGGSNNGKSSGKEQAAVSAKDLDEIVQARKSDKDIPGSAISPLFLKSTSCTKTSIKLVWKKAIGASEYVIYGNACGKNNVMKKLARTSGTKYNIKKAVKKIRKGKYYKFMIAALDKSNKVAAVSKAVHVASKGSKKASNPKKVVVKAKITKTGKRTKKYRKLSSTVLKKGKILKLAASFTKGKKSKVKKHVSMRYESSNTNVAAVSSGGKISARANGKAKIYVYAQNGVRKTISLLVK